MLRSTLKELEWLYTPPPTAWSGLRVTAEHADTSQSLSCTVALLETYRAPPKAGFGAKSQSTVTELFEMATVSNQPYPPVRSTLPPFALPSTYVMTEQCSMTVATSVVLLSAL